MLIIIILITYIIIYYIIIKLLNYSFRRTIPAETRNGTPSQIVLLQPQKSTYKQNAPGVVNAVEPVDASELVLGALDGGRVGAQLGAVLKEGELKTL